jgi:hypothetical protein
MTDDKTTFLGPDETAWLTKLLATAGHVLGFQADEMCLLTAQNPRCFSIFAADEPDQAMRLQLDLDRQDLPSTPLIQVCPPGTSPWVLTGVNQPDVVLIPRHAAEGGLLECRRYIQKRTCVVVYPDTTFSQIDDGNLPAATKTIGDLQVFDLSVSSASAKLANSGQTVLPYPRSRAPFCDFLLVQGPDAQRPAPVDFLNEVRLDALTIYADADLPKPFDQLFLGVGRIGGDLIKGPLYGAALNEVAAPDIATLGPFVLCSHQGESIRVETDSFGLYPVYYAQFGASAYCSNRLHLLIESAHQAGHPINVSHDDLCARWFDDTSMCLMQTTPQTIIAGIDLLLPGQWIDFSLSKACKGMVIASPHSLNMDDISHEDYMKLVKAGAAEIRANVRSICASGLRVTAGLTGGRDSRMIYAALVAEDLQHTVPFHTLDIEQDMPLASGLLRRFGGRFDDQPEFGAIVEPFDKLMHEHISFGFSAYDDIGIMDVANPASRSEIRMDGGAGELYRTVKDRLLTPGMADLEVTAEVIEGFVNSFTVLKTRWDPQMRTVIQNKLGGSLTALRSGSLSRTLEEHYRNFDMRFRFGGLGIIGANANQPLSLVPLCSPSLLEAARRMPMALRRAGRLVFDVTRALHEPLAYAPYDSPDPDRSADAWHRPGPVDGQTIELTPDPAAWQKAMHARYGPVGAPRKTTEYYQRDLDKLRDACLYKLRDVENLGHLFTPELEKKFAWYRKTEHRYGHVWASRLHTVTEALRFGGAVK